MTPVEHHVRTKYVVRADLDAITLAYDDSRAGQCFGVASLSHLYELQIYISVMTVAQACGEPVLQSSREAVLALTGFAVLWCCFTFTPV